MRLVPVALLALLAVACARPPERVPVPTYVLTAEPRSLDPALSTDVPTGEVSALLYETLVRYDLDGRAVPGLALRWDTSADGRTYTFHLDPTARFHDLRPVRAADLGPPAVVERNQIVGLAYRSGGLAILTEGRALARGGVGDVIRVMNLASRATVTGTIGPDGLVAVGPQF
jgi:hypothetical protein